MNIALPTQQKKKQIYLWSVFLFAFVLSFFSLQYSPWTLRALDYVAHNKLPLSEMLFYQFENPDYLLTTAKNFHPVFFSSGLFLPSSQFFVLTILFLILSFFIFLHLFLRFTKNFAFTFKTKRRQNFSAYIFLLFFLPWFIHPFSSGIIFLWFGSLFLFVFVLLNNVIYLKSQDKKKWLWIVILSSIFVLSPFVALPLLFFLPSIFLLIILFFKQNHENKKTTFIIYFLFITFLTIFSFVLYFFVQRFFFLNKLFHLKNIFDFFFIEHLPQKDYQGNEFLSTGIWLFTIFIFYIFLLQIASLFFFIKKLREKNAAFQIRQKNIVEKKLQKTSFQNGTFFFLVVLHFIVQLFFLEQPSYFFLQLILGFSFFYFFLFSHNLQFSFFLFQKTKKKNRKNRNTRAKKKIIQALFFLIFAFTILSKFFTIPLFFQREKTFGLPVQKKWIISASDLASFTTVANQVDSINIVDLHVISYNLKKIPYLFLEQPGEKKQPLFSSKMKNFYAQEMIHAENIFNQIMNSTHKEDYAFFFHSSLPLKDEKFPFRRVYVWKKKQSSIELFLFTL